MEPLPLQPRLRFDRGTLLVELNGNNFPSVRDLIWDPRVGAPRGPAWKHREIAASLSEAGINIRDDVLRPGQHPSPWRAIELRPYQEAALDAWELQGRRGVVILPTGSGKTRVALAA